MVAAICTWILTFGFKVSSSINCSPLNGFYSSDCLHYECPRFDVPIIHISDSQMMKTDWSCGWTKFDGRTGHPLSIPVFVLNILRLTAMRLSVKFAVWRTQLSQQFFLSFQVTFKKLKEWNVRLTDNIKKTLKMFHLKRKSDLCQNFLPKWLLRLITPTSNLPLKN